MHGLSVEADSVSKLSSVRWGPASLDPQAMSLLTASGVRISSTIAADDACGDECANRCRSS